MQQVIKELSGAYSLGDWKLASNLSTGFVNENYKIETASSRFFLRIYRQQPLESIESEMDLYDALSEIEFPTAYPIAKSDGDFVSQTERGFAVLFEFLDGKAPDVTYETAFQIGMAIGKLNNLESRWQSRKSCSGCRTKDAGGAKKPLCRLWHADRRYSRSCCTCA